ncbi:OB-fold protein [Stenoxybacter acetivorans]|uniref:OB-fold protein n=1 Tax=Stenoxybacter acetivorans TaxID=422441 RepID=UPI00068F7F6A|nr:hypothetical protein [Stenoxybacter acetivorans]
MKKVIKWVLIGIACLFVLGLLFGGNKQGTTQDTGNRAASAQNAESASAQNAESAPVEEMLKVTAAQMVKTYDDNEAAGDAAYKGKKLAITGTIESINKDISDNTVINFKGKDFSHVMANLADSEEEKALKLKKNTQLTVICIGDGEVMGSPVARNCIIQ